MSQQRLFATRIPLRWCDLDHLGRVNHGQMLGLLDEARSMWLFEGLGSDSPEQAVVRRIKLEYFDEISVDGRGVNVELSLSRVEDNSLTTLETVTRAAGMLVARAEVTVVMWDPKENRPRALTDSERAGCSLYLGPDVKETGDPWVPTV